MKKFALVVGNDNVLYNRPLYQLMEQNLHDISHIYITPSHHPDQNEKRYKRISLKLLPFSFIALYLWRSFYYKFFVFAFWSSRLRAKSSLSNLASYFNITSSYINDVNESAFRACLKEKKITAIVSLTSLLYQEDIINTQSLKIYNFHPGLLPNNKGRFPMFWAILKGSRQGITCHEVVKKIDTGKIIYQEILPAIADQDMGKVMAQVKDTMPAFIVKSMDRISNDQYDFHPLESKSFYGPYPTDSDIEEYHEVIKSGNTNK